MKEFILPVSIAAAGFMYFMAKAAGKKGALPVIRMIFGYSETAYQSGNVMRIGYGTPAGDRDTLPKEAALLETKNVVEQLSAEMQGAFPFRLRLSYILLHYFALPYGEDSTVGQNVAIITSTMINARSNNGYTDADMTAIDDAIGAIYAALPPIGPEANAFAVIIDYTVNKFDPAKSTPE